LASTNAAKHWEFFFYKIILLKLLKKKPVLEGRNGVVITNLADDI